MGSLLVGLIGLVWAGAALGAPLAVEVVVDPPLPRPVRAALEVPVEPFGWSIDAVVVDGARSEPAWQVSPTSPLGPLATGPAPPEARLRILADPVGLVLGVDAVPDHEVQVLVDPDGQGQRWWRVHLPAGTAERCDWAAVEPRWEVNNYRPAGAPCVAVELEVAAGPDGWELRLRWDALAATEHLVLGWQALDASGGGGTWAPRGGAVLAPDHGIGLVPADGRPLAVDPSGARLVVRVDGDQWVGTLTEATGDWRWQVLHRGRVLDSGSFDAAGSFRVARRDLSSVRVLARPVVQAPRVWEYARVATPVFRDRIEVAWKTSLGGVIPVRVRDPEGTVLGEAALDLPRGDGVLWIAARAEWPEVIEVEVADWVVGRGLAVRGGR